MHGDCCNQTSEHTTFWTIHRGHSPVLATAIHDGHDVDRHLTEWLAVDEATRLREEDPFTGDMIRRIPNRLVCSQSRFCIDLNRALEQAIYLTPADAWGLQVWGQDLREEDRASLRLMHEDYYRVLKATLEGLACRHGAFVVLDIHSYNHRRDGPHALPTPIERAPDINIGTFSMDRRRWAPVVDAFVEHCAGCTVNGRSLDVKENIAFQGKGEQTRFIHQHFPDTGCAIAVEFKKIFMDEWTGEPNEACIRDIEAMLASSVPVLERALRT